MDTNSGTAAVTAGEKITELEAEKGVRLKGHWLSVKMTTEGNAPKAGLLFSGVHDQRGELLRLVYDATTGKLTDGRGNDITSLPVAEGGGIEFILNFFKNLSKVFINSFYSSVFWLNASFRLFS